MLCKDITMKQELKKKVFREFAKKENLEPLSFNMKYAYNAKKYLIKNRGIKTVEIDFLCWGYDLEFFSIQHAVDEFHKHPLDIENKFIYKLMKEGWIRKYINKTELKKDNTYRMFYPKGGALRFRMKYCLTYKAERLVKEYEKICNTAVTMRGKDILKYE